MLKRFKCVISYDGTHFSGFQSQPSMRTVQGEIERILTRMHKNIKVKIEGAGRTDAGVHAKGQVFHFDTHLNILAENWKRALNAQLPDDIFVHHVQQVSPCFHSRFDAIEREYRYFIWNNEERDIFRRHYTYYNMTNFNIDLIKQACQQFEGTHDFTSFCSAQTRVKGSKVRTLYEVSCTNDENIVQFKIRGNGFLYNMVRIIVGTLLDIGAGKLHIDDVEQIFLKKDRTAAGKTAPPEGLFLWSIKYPNEKLND